MQSVVIYGFTGRFTGKTEYDYHFPEIDGIHNCMLFLSQEASDLVFDDAITECARYGFTQIENIKGNLLKVEVLNTDGFKKFTGYYEEALSEGSSLVYYPNT